MPLPRATQSVKQPCPCRNQAVTKDDEKVFVVECSVFIILTTLVLFRDSLLEDSSDAHRIQSRKDGRRGP